MYAPALRDYQQITGFHAFTKPIRMFYGTISCQSMVPL